MMSSVATEKPENGLASEHKKSTQISNGKTCKGDIEEIPGLEGVAPEQLEAYISNYKAHKKGMSHAETVKAYDAWAEQYDKDLCPGLYNGPEIAAKALSDFYSNLRDRSSMKIVDVAAGTGRVGEQLFKNGFKNLDALEPSAGMLQLLRQKGIYGETFEASIGYQPIPNIPTNAYDALVIAGGMGEAHIPVTACDEMVRIVKPGGNIFIVMREEYLSYVAEYVGKLEPYMIKLEEKGCWKQVSRNKVPEYSFGKTGIVFIYKVLTDTTSY